MQKTTAETIKGPWPSGAVLLDVRTAMEHDECRVQSDHLHIPLDQLDPDGLAAQLPGGKATPVVVLCKAGMRAQKAAERLDGAGFSNVRVVDGGLDACERCGVAVHKGRDGARDRLSLERQVRIAAGLLVVTGALLSIWVDIAFLGLSIAVGCGLVFAGITNRCGLALLLTRAPWNKLN